MTAARSAQSTAARNSVISVFHERRCIGFLLRRGPTGFESFNASEQSLGLFQSEHEAVAVLLARGAAP